MYRPFACAAGQSALSGQLFVDDARNMSWLVAIVAGGAVRPTPTLPSRVIDTSSLFKLVSLKSLTVARVPYVKERRFSRFEFSEPVSATVMIPIFEMRVPSVDL